MPHISNFSNFLNESSSEIELCWNLLSVLQKKLGGEIVEMNRHHRFLRFQSGENNYKIVIRWSSSSTNRPFALTLMKGKSDFTIYVSRDFNEDDIERAERMGVNHTDHHNFYLKDPGSVVFSSPSMQLLKDFSQTLKIPQVVEDETQWKYIFDEPSLSVEDVMKVIQRMMDEEKLGVKLTDLRGMVTSKKFGF